MRFPVIDFDGGVPRIVNKQNGGWTLEILPSLAWWRNVRCSFQELIKRTWVKTFICPSRRSSSTHISDRAMQLDIRQCLQVVQ